MNEVTRLLMAINRGDSRATDELFPIVYDELRRLAAAKLARESPGQTLQATALVHEVYLRLLGGAEHGRRESEDTPAEAREETDRRPSLGWQSRGHFFAAAAEAMRRILVEQARRKHRLKRGGNWAKVELEVAEIAVEPPSDEILARDEALTKLEAHNRTKADVVKLRYFAGLSIDEVAAALGISTPTVKRYWAYARAWLLREISKGDDPQP